MSEGSAVKRDGRGAWTSEASEGGAPGGRARLTLWGVTFCLLLSAPAVAGLVQLRAQRSSQFPAAMYRGGPDRSGAYPWSHGRHMAGMAWRFATEGMIVASPTVQEGRVFIGSGDGSFHALDLETGRSAWTVELGEPISSTAAVGEGFVHVTGRSGTVHTLNIETGEVIWTLEAQAPVPFPWGHESGDQYTPSPLLLGDTLVVAGSDGHVRALAGATGRPHWSVDLGVRIVASPTFGAGRLFIADAEGRVRALDRSGRESWTFETLGSGLDSSEFGFDRRTIQSTPAYADGRLFFGSRDGKVYAVDAETGTEIWRADHGTSWVNTGPAVAGGRVYVGSSDRAFAQALDAVTGEEVWNRPGMGLLWSSPAVAGDVVYYGNWGGRLRALDRRTGEILWAFPVDGMILSSPVVAGEWVLFGAADGGVYALRAADRPVRRHVFHDPGLARATRVRSDVLAGGLERFGYQTVDTAGLRALLTELSADATRSVIVFATDHLPADEAGVAQAFRAYLDAGGKIVWPGGAPPLLWPLDPESGRPGRYGDVAWETTSHLLDVDHGRSIFDVRAVRVTDEGTRWGLEGWWRQAWGVAPDGVTRVLGYDDWGLAASWVKEYGGGPGTGFVLVPAKAGLYGLIRAAEARPAASGGDD